ncbi:MAG: enoyl-CoA hydratase-related protein [Gammaproteobacteria bacterium]
MTTYQTMTTETHNNGVLQINLNRPAQLNALSTQLLDELHQLLMTAQRDTQIKAFLLTGTGKAFCAGADINRLAELDANQGLAFARQGQAIFRLLETCGKPSLAAVNGYAFGGGCELAMATTIRIASKIAQFGQPEVKLGVIPGYGGTQRLARLIGKGRALDLCLTGRFISAQQAYDWGLVSELTEPEQLLPRALEMLQGILDMAPLAIRSVMEVIDQGFDMPLPEALELEALHFGLTCATQDKTEGVNAFLAKRNARFVGQ